jgi:hypothetical protein
MVSVYDEDIYDIPIEAGGAALPAGNINDGLIFNGTEWVAVPTGTTFSFSIASFSDGQASPQEIGVGVWKAIGDLSFTASYTNGPATGAYVSHTGWADLVIPTPFSGPTVSIAAQDYPAAPGSLTFTLNAAKGAETATSTETVSFYNKILWGTLDKASGYLEAEVLALDSEALSNSKGRTITVNPAATFYILYALPVRLGTVKFYVDNFEGGFIAPETVSVTNTSGFTEDYYVYRSTHPGLGSTTIVVV